MRAESPGSYATRIDKVRKIRHHVNNREFSYFNPDFDHKPLSKSILMKRRRFILNSALAGLALPGLTAYGSISPGNNSKSTAGFALPALPYAPDALEPHIDALTMQIHHGKHHAAYVNNLNAALEKEPSLQGKSLDELLAGIPSLPEGIRTTVRNNAGGHWNHSFFWNILTPDRNTAPSEKLSSALSSTFGSMDNFKAEFEKTAMSVFGSGWAWLVKKGDGTLAVTKTLNQDNPLMDTAEVKGKPLLGIDIWEHAYYLKYQNRRAEYLKAVWNVVDWRKMSGHYEG